jgi:hypothetical protein
VILHQPSKCANRVLGKVVQSVEMVKMVFMSFIDISLELILIYRV